MSTAIVYDFKDIKRLQDRLAKLGNFDHAALLEVVGAEGESQTHRRLREEKTDPEGNAWESWSDDYALTRHGGNSLLMGEGDLDDSVQFVVGIDQVEIGSNLPHAAIHNFGGEEVGINIPARQYLGFSDENEADLLAVIDDFLDDQLRAL